jgi:hypothetical protein
MKFNERKRRKKKSRYEKQSIVSLSGYQGAGHRGFAHIICYGDKRTPSKLLSPSGFPQSNANKSKFISWWLRFIYYAASL